MVAKPKEKKCHEFIQYLCVYILLVRDMYYINIQIQFLIEFNRDSKYMK